jgi:chemotaxis protein MotB
MARKKHEDHENHERWLVSYADFITLLFAFFVVMFATSQTDKAKAQQVSDSVKKALEGQSFKTMVKVILGGTIDNTGQGNSQKNGPGGQKRAVKTTENPQGKIVELLPSLELLTKDLEQEVKSGKLQLSMGARGLTISFAQAALFPSGGDEISPEFYPTIQKIVDAMKQVPNPVRTEGHTDSVPIHNSRFRSNWELSAARSIALVELFTKLGEPRDKLSIAGYADTAPVESNDTVEGRQKNRRVDIVILNEKGLQGEPERLAQESKAADKKTKPESPPVKK